MKNKVSFSEKLGNKDFEKEFIELLLKCGMITNAFKLEIMDILLEDDNVHIEMFGKTKGIK